MLVTLIVACTASLDAATTPKPTPAPPPPTTPSPTPFPLPEPAWGACPPDFASIFQSCATVAVPQRWDAPTNHANLTFLLGRVTPSNPDTPNTTIWYLGDDCFVSGLSEWVASMLNLNVYVVAVYPRGSPFSIPTIQCDASSTDPVTGWPLPSCGKNLTESNVDAGIFSFEEMANDLKYVIPKLGSSINVVFADGFMTELGQRLQVVQPNVANAYVFSGFTAPSRYDAVMSPLDAFESVAQRVLQQCVATDPKCVGWFGGQDPWQVWVRTLEAASRHDLPCTAALKWNVASYRDALANIAAMLMSSSPDPFTQPTAVATQAFFPAFIYRLQRCNSNDVAALTHMYAKLNATSTVAPPASGQCATNLALRFNLIINEMLQTMPSAEGVAASISARVVQPSAQYFTALAEVAVTWPKYNVSTSGRQIGSAPQPTALLSGDADVFSPLELAQYAVSLSYTRSATQSFTTIARGMHPILSTAGKTCVVTVLANVATTRTVDHIPSCGGNAVAAYDFFGTSTSASILEAYLSIDNLWDYTSPLGPVNPFPLLPPSPEPPSPNTPTPQAPQVPSPESNTDKHAVIALSILLAVTWVGLFAFVWIKHGGPSCLKSKKDFYSELNR
jgi:hypothetical protein